MSFKLIQNLRQCFTSTATSDKSSRAEKNSGKSSPATRLAPDLPPARTPNTPTQGAPVPARPRTPPGGPEHILEFSIRSAPRSPNKLKKKRPTPPPSSPSSSPATPSSSSGSWYSNTATNSGSGSLSETDATPDAHPPAARVHLTTPAGQGFALHDGHLHEWDKLNGAWRRLDLPPVRQLRLGSDGCAYALANDNRVLRLGAAGPETFHRPARTPRDFAVSPTGGMAALSARGPESSLTAMLTWRPPGTPAKAPGLRLPLPAAMDAAVSIAFDAEGRLVAMNAAGQAWRARIAALDGPEAAAAWRPVQPPPVGTAFRSLASTARGAVVAVDDEGGHHEIARDGRWQPAPANPPRSVDTHYARFATGPSGTSHFAMGFVPPPGEKTPMAPVPEDRQPPAWLGALLVPSAFRRDHPGQSLHRRHADWARSHVLKKEPAAGQRLRREIEQAWAAVNPATAVPLRKVKVDATREAELRHLVRHVNHNTRELLHILSQDGVRYASAPKARVESEDNALWRLWKQRDALFGGEDEETRQVNWQLREMLAAGFFVPTQAEARRTIQPWHARRFTNRHAVLTGKLASDHAALQAVFAQVRERAAAGAGEDPQRVALDIERLVGNARDRIGGGDGNDLTRLAEEGVVDLLTLGDRGTGKALDEQLRDDWKAIRFEPIELQKQPPLAPQTTSEYLAAVREYGIDRGARTRLNAGVGARVDANTALALDRLELELGLRTGTAATLLPDHVAPPDRFRAPRARVMSDDNVLYRLHGLRCTLYGAGTGSEDTRQVTARLKALLDRGVFVSADSRHHLVVGTEAAPGSGVPFQAHLVKNKLGVLTGKMVHDHAVLQQAHRRLGEGKRTDERANRLSAHYAEQLDGGDDNPVGMLFDRNFRNVDRARAGAEAIRYANVGIAHEGHRLNRAARMQGAIEEDISDFYVRAVQEMRPGESITLKSERTLGLDMDGYGIVTQLSNRGLDGAGPRTPGGIRLNIVPNVQPVPTISARREHSVTLTRTNDGLQMAFGQASGADANLAAKVMWGGGAFLSNGNGAGTTVTGVLFAGAEAIPSVTMSVQTDNSVALHIPQGDDGEVQKMVRAFFGGATTPFQLMQEARSVASERTVTKSAGARVDTHVLATAVGVVGLDHDALGGAPDNRTKLVIAPFLEQISVGGKVVHTRTRTHDADGGAESRGTRFEPTVKASHITILEAQHNAKRSLADAQRPRDPDARIADGIEFQDKYPLYIKVVQKNLWGRPVTTDGLRVAYDENRIPGAVTMVATARNTAVNDLAAKIGVNTARTRAFDERHLPQLGPLLRDLPALRSQIERIADSGLPAQALLELTPLGLENLRIALDWAPPGQRDAVMRSELDKLLSGDPANFRITEIKVASTYTYRTGAQFGAGPLRTGSRAENAFQTTRGRIVVEYDDRPVASGPRVRARSDGDALLGAHSVPAFGVLESMERHGEVDRLANPLASPAANALANLPTRRRMAADARLRAVMGVAQPVAPLASVKESHVGVESGRLVFRAPLPGDRWNMHAMSARMQTRWLESLDDDHRLMTLRAMSEGATGWLTRVRRLTEDEFKPMLERTPPLPISARPADAPRRLGRSLHVNDILDDLRDGRLGSFERRDSWDIRPRAETELDPAQRAVLRIFFGDRHEGIDRDQVARLLDDPIRLATFQHAAEPKAPALQPTLGVGGESTDGLIPALGRRSRDDPRPVHISAV